MKTSIKVAAYAASLVVFFVAAMWLGGRFDLGGDTGTAQPREDSPADHGAAADLPGGLQVADAGYRLVVDDAIVPAGEDIDFGFRVIGPDGQPVTSFTPQHEKEVHLIVVRRDLTGYHHLHPEVGDDGTWRTPLRLAEAGQYRVFADILPANLSSGITLGIDIAAPGEYLPTALPAAQQTATVGEYTVDLAADATAGETSALTLTVHRDGEPVTDLQPYLGAYGHLVSLRDGDLAYLHVHPDHSDQPGPEVSFTSSFPSPGGYRLFFDFQHNGDVRTAEFTVVVPHADSTEPSPHDDAPESEEPGTHDDDHGDGH